MEKVNGNIRELFPEGIYVSLFEAARPFLDTRDNEVHTLISCGYALELLKDGGRPEIVLPAVILHDIGWSRVPEELHLSSIGPNATTPEARDVHEREGAEMASGILCSFGFPDEDVKTIAHIIGGHDSRVECGSLEEAVVRDADKLYRFSAKGFEIIAGWYSFDRLKFLGWLESVIPEWFLTDSGKRLAREEAALRRAELAQV